MFSDKKLDTSFSGLVLLNLYWPIHFFWDVCCICMPMCVYRVLFGGGIVSFGILSEEGRFISLFRESKFWHNFFC